MSDGGVIVAEGLRREFWAPGGATVVAVESASFEVSPGEVFGLLGPNGAGKTTTLHMLATLTRPTAGTASICGHDVVTQSRRARGCLGYVSATSGLPERLTASECLLTFARLQKIADPRSAVEASVVSFSLSSVADRPVEQLSTGMKQRLKIACAVVHRPPVLIFDEPTAGLDVIATDELLALIEGLRDGGAAVVFSTHVMSEAARLCDRVAIIYAGSIRAVDRPEGLLEQTGAESLERAFLDIVRS